MFKENEPLLFYIEEALKARTALTELLGLEIKAFDFQKALCESLGIENDPTLLLDKNLSHSEMISVVKEYPFYKTNPTILCEFIEDPPLVPDSIPRLLTERTLKVCGEVWRVHKSDADPFPSVPHAHNYESGVVLHLGTGEMFDINRNFIGRIGTKQLTRIRDFLKVKDVVLPPIA
jgi:hypothetical protein